MEKVMVWESYKKWFFAWEGATANYLERWLKSPPCSSRRALADGCDEDEATGDRAPRPGGLAWVFPGRSGAGPQTEQLESRSRSRERLESAARSVVMPTSGVQNRNARARVRPPGAALTPALMLPCRRRLARDHLGRFCG
jgi:hypothetical protein